MTPFAQRAIEAARIAGNLMRENAATDLVVNEEEKFDIKLELDVRCQDAISEHLLQAFPDHAIFGEEGLAGDQQSPWQWIVDPIDGTMNFFHGIPHYCVSIALRHEGNLVLGIIFDPCQDELWLAEDGKATINGQPIKVSKREDPAQAMVTVGFSKSAASLDAGFRRYKHIVGQVRKSRLMGSAALAMSYIATGRLDAYIEHEISLWDIAAGKLLIENAGGTVALTPLSPEKGEEKYSIIASSAALHPFCLEAVAAADTIDGAP
jgi:myo-inositol-1(or 4)-monophosphatase